ncbi:MAG TPA: MarR family transcriptional regulator [Steroidobacteraceae bacterium]|jgi:DNA-binding MarR family transcriptional regulator|nr:MarR family transcriptional regulator [Steroidobacteraceae bacterium]
MSLAADRLRNLGFLVRDVSRLYGRHFERHARELELTLPQCKVLAHLSRNEGISQARLAELTETDPMTLVRTLDRMQQDRWIERRADPADRRAHRLFLCEDAKPVVARMWKIADQARGEAISVLSQPEREQLLDLLARVHENLQTLDARAADARRLHHQALESEARASKGN